MRGGRTLTTEADRRAGTAAAASPTSAPSVRAGEPAALTAAAESARESPRSGRGRPPGRLARRIVMGFHADPGAAAPGDEGDPSIEFGSRLCIPCRAVSWVGAGAGGPVAARRCGSELGAGSRDQARLIARRPRGAPAWRSRRMRQPWTSASAASASAGCCAVARASCPGISPSAAAADKRGQAAWPVTTRRPSARAGSGTPSCTRCLPQRCLGAQRGRAVKNRSLGGAGRPR